MRRLREIPCRMLARTRAVQFLVLVALIQCATMATEVVEFATENKEDVRFRYSRKNLIFFLAYFCAVLRFPDPSYAAGFYLINRSHMAVRLFSNRSQMTSKCGKNKKSGARGVAECVFDVLTIF